MLATSRTGTARTTRLSAILAGFICLLLVQPAGADSGNSMSVSAELDGFLARVTGSVTITQDGPFVRVVTDDASPVTPQDLDLVAVDMATRSNGDLAVRWQVASMSSDTEGLPGAVYQHRFKVDGSANYEVAAARVSGSGTSAGPTGWFSRCLPERCEWLAIGNPGAEPLTRDVAVEFDPSAATIEATVPSSALAGVIEDGAVISAYKEEGPSPSESYAGVGDLEQRFAFDNADMTETAAYGLTVGLAAGDPDASPQTLAYSTPANVGTDHSFSGSVGAERGQAVFVKACFGSPTNCFFGTSEVL